MNMLLFRGSEMMLPLAVLTVAVLAVWLLVWRWYGRSGGVEGAVRWRLRRYVQSVWIALLLAMVVAWVLSYLCTIQIVLDRFEATADGCIGRGWYVASCWGTVSFRRGWTLHREEDRPKPSPWQLTVSVNRAQGMGVMQSIKSNVLGFKFKRQPFTGPTMIDRTWWAVVPYWFLVLILTIPPARWRLRDWRTTRRRRRGLCLACGYDLRASRERCPECGTAIAGDCAARDEAKAI